VAERRPTVIEVHGDTRVDEWAWLRDRDDPAVLEVLRAENEYTEALGAHLAGFRERLFDEIRSRIVETDLSVPVRKGPWWYYSRTFEGRSYPVHCRLPVDGGGRVPDTPPGTESAGDTPAEPDSSVDAGTWPDEVVMLDENALAEGHSYLALGSLVVSPDHQLLAYGADTTGDERFTLRIRDLRTGDDRPESIEGTSYGVAWAGDDATVFYTRPDEANRPHQVWRHRVGTPAAADTLVLEEPDERFHLGVGRTKDGAFVLIEMRSQTTSELHVIDAMRPDDPPRVVDPRRQGVEYALEHHSGTFFALTNDQAENFRLVARPADAGGHRPWRELVPHRADVRLDGVDVFARHVVLFERIGGEARIRIVALGDHPTFAGPLELGDLVGTPESPSTAWTGANPEFDSSVLRYEYSSLVTPRSVFDIDMDTHTAVVRKRQPVIGYDASAYVTERAWAVADDGTRVPISLMARRDTPRDGTAPCLLYGYGAYEASIDPLFSSIRLSLLDRGFVFAIAHVRGGGELGRRWYEDGKLTHKPNTFSDFVACARHLVETGWTRPELLVARGGSAGGLLMGAAANAAPEAFRAIVAEVPFVDCLTTMLDETLPLTVIEWEEWGNPGADPDIYRVMRSYSPYDNVAPVRYPSMYVTAGLEDPRVGYWEPAKWVQKLRAAHPDNRVQLKVDLEAGHGGPTGRYDAWRDEAEVLAFVLEAVGRAEGAGASEPGSGG